MEARVLSSSSSVRLQNDERDFPLHCLSQAVVKGRPSSLLSNQEDPIAREAVPWTVICERHLSSLDRDKDHRDQGQQPRVNQLERREISGTQSGLDLLLQKTHFDAIFGSIGMRIGCPMRRHESPHHEHNSYHWANSSPRCVRSSRSEQVFPVCITFEITRKHAGQK